MPAALRAPVLVAVAALGCGGSTPREAPLPAPGPVVVAHQPGAEQAETAVGLAVAASGPSIVVAFNDYAIDPAFPGGPEYTITDGGDGLLGRRGLSLMGWSVSTDGGRSYAYRGKVRPPAGWAAIWGDPSIAVDPKHPAVVYLTDLAISDASWQAGAIADGELPDPGSFTDGVCVARSTDGGASFPDVACVARPAELQPLCLPGPSTCVDHTAVGVDGAGRLYVATEIFHADGDTGALVHVFRSASAASWSELVALDPPPPAPMETEPTIVTSPAGDVWIAGATTAFPRDVAVNQQPSGKDTWGIGGMLLADAGADLYTGALDAPVHTAPRTSFRIGRTFALAVGEHEGEPDIRLVFSTRRAGAEAFFLGAVHCAAGLDPNRTCVREPAWETASWAGQQLMPSMSRGGVAPFRFEVAFLSSDRRPDAEGVIQLVGRSLGWSPSGGATADEHRLTPADWPVCARWSAATPESRHSGYWGDYFGTAQGVDTRGAPVSVTAFSDSRPGTDCARADRFADPLHVAATRW